ncbi:MAG: hypothetical protein DIZ80_07215 [endosymbiont of Galathealinum brachiosum]|uniref:Lipopolysaccharide assembly protein A domain-containing protein n=1 Tax=endosymbiont of Galathealinum brachiosum TaxID=2200906 RepID=A0A370DG70_9GAMM|nr:MAG: hypothetical protein DIZ80_07215 [endosymbiont of Galathealinum brachiosum]
MIRFISLLISIPLIILVAAFTYKNAQLVSIDLFIMQVDLPMAMVLLMTLLVGVIIGFIFNLMTLLNQKKKYLRLKHKKETLNGLSEVLKQSDK